MSLGMNGRFSPPTDVSLDEARADWQRLAERTGNFFSTWEWADAWVRHLGNGRELKLHACRTPGGEVAAILPLCLSRSRPARILRFAGHGPAHELGPVCDPADREAAGLALAELLPTLGFDAFVADRVQPGLAPATGGRGLRSEPSPVLPVRGRRAERSGARGFPGAAEASTSPWRDGAATSASRCVGAGASWRASTT